MNGNLNVSPSELKDLGNKIQLSNDDFSALLNKINALNGELQSSWKGSDADKYIQKIEEQSKIMKQLSESIDEIGAILVRLADAYSQASENNKSMLN